MRKTIYETNYDRMVKLGVITKDGVVPGQCRRSGVPGLMDWGGGTLTASGRRVWE